MNDDVSAVKSPGTPLASAPFEATQPHPPPQIPDHELLRRIGLGSYGEVWLARSVMGTYRAVKVVYRDRFENERPFEREYSGIQKFEPISRSHEGLVDIRQIGRNDQDGYFYYVMELADGAEMTKRTAQRASGTLEQARQFRQHSNTPVMFGMPPSVRTAVRLSRPARTKRCICTTPRPANRLARLESMTAWCAAPTTVLITGGLSPGGQTSRHGSGTLPTAARPARF
jgi:hypothetical protein